MYMSIAISVHILALIIWIGGMFFAHSSLRPASQEILEPPLRLKLWQATFQRFFLWVWIAIALILASGFWMFLLYPSPPFFIHLMTGIGSLMMLIFFHIYFAPYQRLKKAVISENWSDGAKALGQIRTMVGINLSLGIITTIIATAGKYFIS